MTTHLYVTGPHDQATTDRLYVEFEGVLSRSVVDSTLAQAARDLAGQIAPEAGEEMAYRLAQYRLGQLDPDAAPQ